MSALLVLLSSVAAKPKPSPPEPDSLLEVVRDAFLWTGEYGVYVYWIALTGFCLANAKAILGASKDINFFHGLALQLMTAYGGSTICAILCGNPVVFFVNESLAPVALLAFSALYVARTSLFALMESNLGAVCISIAYETTRCHVLMNCAAGAAKTMPAFLSGAYPVPIVAPLVCGVIGGCGGAFLPADKGLKPLENGTNWRVASAMLCSVWLHCVMNDPHTKATLLGLAPMLEQQSWCRFCAVAFCVVGGTASVLTGRTPLGANPLVIAAPAKSKAKKA